ncbi:MAG: TonB-dependent receptor [Steroidobacteraceae bacterium]
MRTILPRVIAPMLALGLGLGLGAPAFAAAVVAADDVEEIIVTATKTGAVAAQSIPAGISAVSGNTLEESNVHALEDIARLVPSLQMGAAAPGDLQPIIRGIQSPGAGTVGVYFDETVVTGVNFQNGGGQTPDIGAYDIDRLEVLKGPQGTLFGASSMSGTVRFISNKPDAKAFDARVSIRGDDLNEGAAGYGGDGMLNVPVISDVLAVRAVGWYERRGGFIDEYVGLNAITKITDANDIEKEGARLSARFTPNDRMTLDAYVMWQKYTDNGPQGFSDVPTGTMLPVPIIAGAPFLIGLTVPPLAGVVGERILTTPSAGENSSRITLFGTTFNYDLGFGTATATASKYSNNPYYFAWDTSGTSTRFGLVNIPNFFATGELAIDAPFRVQQQHVRDVESMELRFSSKFDLPVNFVAGGYFQKESSDNDLLVVTTDPVTGRSLCRIWFECIADPTSSAANSILFATEQQYSINAYALFAHTDWKITDRLTLGVGGRYFNSREHDIDYTEQAFQGSIPFTVPPAFGGPVNTVPIPGLDVRINESKPTWDASLGFQRTPEELYYIRAATGFRQGGPNNSVTAKQLGVTIPDNFEPDTVYSYEIGAKTSWADHRLTLNGALFTMIWDNMQVPGQDATGVISFINNAAKSRVDGVELELSARPLPGLRTTIGVTGLDARLTEDQVTPGGPVGLDGDRIPKVPKWTFAGTADYTLPGKLLGATTTLRTNFSYTGKSYNFFNSTFEDYQPIGDYFLMNVSASFNFDRLEFRLFVNNVTDKAAVLDVFGQGADPQQKITVEPRSIGAQVSWHLK